MKVVHSGTSKPIRLQRWPKVWLLETPLHLNLSLKMAWSAWVALRGAREPQTPPWGARWLSFCVLCLFAHQRITCWKIDRICCDIWIGSSETLEDNLLVNTCAKGTEKDSCHDLLSPVLFPMEAVFQQNCACMGCCFFANDRKCPW